MIDVIGMDYNTALNKLSAAGYKVNCTTTSSNKPAKSLDIKNSGTYSDIVVRQKEKEDNIMDLVINNMRVSK